MPTRDLKFRYLGDSKSLAKASGTAEKSLGGVDQKSRTAGKGMNLLKGTAGKLGVVLGGAALAGQASVAVARAEEMSSAYAATEQIIKQTGGAAGVTGGEVKGMAKEMSLATGVDKALITEGTNLILTFKNIKNEAGEGNDVFTRTNAIMLDLAAVMKTDAKSSALQLGKALNDPVKGVASLARIGVTFTDVQKEQIRLFVEAGDVASAQGIILGELESQVGGVAEATADSTAKISNAWKEVQEQIGNALLPAIDAILPAMLAVGEGAPEASKKIGLGFSFMQKTAGMLLDTVDVLAGPFVNLGDIWDDQDEILFQVNKRLTDYAERIADGSKESDVFVSALRDLNLDGDATVGTLGALIEATGISGEEFKDAAKFALENAEAFGITEDQADQLKRELRKLEQGTSDMGDEADGATGSLGDMAEAEDDAGDAAGDAAAEVVNLADEMRKLADPVFKAESAADKFAETLARVQEDSILTQDELEELTRDYGDMQAATDAVNADNIDAYEQQVDAALGHVDASVAVTEGELRSLPDTAIAEIQATRAALGGTITHPLSVHLRVTGPTQAEINRMVAIAIRNSGVLRLL